MDESAERAFWTNVRRNAINIVRSLRELPPSERIDADLEATLVVLIRRAEARGGLRAYDFSEAQARLRSQ